MLGISEWHKPPSHLAFHHPASHLRRYRLNYLSSNLLLSTPLRGVRPCDASLYSKYFVGLSQVCQLTITSPCSNAWTAWPWTSCHCESRRNINSWHKLVVRVCCVWSHPHDGYGKVESKEKRIKRWMRRSRGRSVLGVDWLRKGPHFQWLSRGDVYWGMCDSTQGRLLTDVIRRQFVTSAPRLSCHCFLGIS